MTVGGGRGVLHCNCVILYREGGGRLGKKGRMIGVRGRERDSKLAHKKQLLSTTVMM